MTTNTLPDEVAIERMDRLCDESRAVLKRLVVGGKPGKDSEAALKDLAQRRFIRVGKKTEPPVPTYDGRACIAFEGFSSAT